MRNIVGFINLSADVSNRGWNRDGQGVLRDLGLDAAPWRIRDRPLPTGLASIGVPRKGEPGSSRPLGRTDPGRLPEEGLPIQAIGVQRGLWVRAPPPAARKPVARSGRMGAVLPPGTARTSPDGKDACLYV